MADNVLVTAGTDTTIATDQVGSAHFQKVKLADGTADSSTVIEAGGGLEAGALRVTIASDSTGVISIDDNGGAITVDGTVTANLSATDNAVLDSIQAAVEVLDNAISGTEMQVDVVSMPTVTIQDGGNTITVDGTVNLGATDTANLAAIKTAIEILDNAISGTEMQVDVVAALPAGDNNIGNMDVASIAAGETHIGEVGLADDSITITCSLDTSAYADADVLFDTQEIAGAVRNNGDTCILQSVHVLDKADQGVDFELLFLNAATSIGTENAAIDISAANAAAVIGHFAFTNDYVDLINSQVRSEGGIGLVLEAGAATTSLYVAGISKGAGTYGASDILITFGFLRN